MGYTHYWSIKDVKAQKEYNAAKKEINKFLEWESEGSTASYIEINPNIKNGEISFNGATYEESCEEFYLPKSLKTIGRNLSGFCKTNRHEYDVMVIGSLFILKKYMGSAITLQSDGYDNPNSFDDEIQYGYELFKNFQLTTYNSFDKIPLSWLFS